MRIVLALCATFILSCGLAGHRLDAQVPQRAPKSTTPRTTVKPELVNLFSLQITKLPRDQFGNGIKPESKENVAFWLANSGTAVDLRFKIDRPIARFDESASRILKFADDKGGDLTRSPKGEKIDGFFEVNKPIHVKLGPKSNEGEVILRAYGTPTPGSTKLTIEADLVFRVGRKEKTGERKGLEPKPGTKVEVGPLRMTFKDPKEGGGGFVPGFSGGPNNGEMQMSIAYERPSKLLKEVQWLDSDGKALRTIEGDFFDAAVGGGVMFSMPKLARIGVRVVYFESSEVITVPLRLNTGVGF